MNKTRFLVAAVVVLALLNIFSLLGHWRRPHGEGPRKIIIKRLHFDREQTAAYEALIEKHRADIRQNDQALAEARQAMYACLNSDDLSAKDSLLAAIGRQQMAIEQSHFAHFQDIKKLCRPEQMADFTLLVGDLEKLFNKPKGPGKQ